MRVKTNISVIIEKKLFESVQMRMNSNEHAPARPKAKMDYLLSAQNYFVVTVVV